MRAVMFNPGEGFDPERVVTNHQPVDNRTKQFTEDGLFSTRIFGNSDGSIDRYCCACGALEGKFNHHEVCSTCYTQVELRSSDIMSIGWIDLNGYAVMNPILYHHIRRIIAPKNLVAILDFQPRLTLDGHHGNDDEQITPWDNLGMIEFREKFHEILDYYYEQRNKETMRDSYEFILNNEDKLWVEHIPIFSALLRPAIMIGKKLNFAEENALYSMMIKMAGNLRKKHKIERIAMTVLPNLYEIQCTLCTLAEKIISNFSGKHGFYRENILGNRFNFSGRMVIAPINVFRRYPLNAIELPYLAGVELYKFEIIKVLSATMSVMEAERRWWQGTLRFDPQIHAVLEELRLRTEGNLGMLINRNPTIDFGSLQNGVVGGFKTDYYDYTMSVCNLVLGLFNGDYDGDVFNVISLKDKRFRDFFQRLSPQYMLIDRNDGRYNRKCSLDKDYALGLASFLS